MKDTIEGTERLQKILSAAGVASRRLSEELIVQGRVTVNGKTVTGVVHSINFQRPDVMLSKSTFDPATGAIHMEADATGEGGAKVHYIIDGKLANGTMSGSWNHDGKKGDFKLTKK